MGTHSKNLWQRKIFVKLQAWQHSTITVSYVHASRSIKDLEALLAKCLFILVQALWCPPQLTIWLSLVHFLMLYAPFPLLSCVLRAHLLSVTIIRELPISCALVSFSLLLPFQQLLLVVSKSITGVRAPLVSKLFHISLRNGVLMYQTLCLRHASFGLHSLCGSIIQPRRETSTSCSCLFIFGRGHLAISSAPLHHKSMCSSLVCCLLCFMQSRSRERIPHLMRFGTCLQL